jgi:uncharacterized protein YndB with AHSA1/START domain
VSTSPSAVATKPVPVEARARVALWITRSCRSVSFACSNTVRNGHSDPGETEQIRGARSFRGNACRFGKTPIDYGHDPATGEPFKAGMSRADVADFMLKQVVDGTCTFARHPQPRTKQSPANHPSKGPGTMATNTIRLHRVLRAAPERVYRAFLDADAMAKWLPPNGFTGKVHHMDAKVGGTHKMSFTNFTTGKSHSFGGRYLELTPHERIRYTDQFDDPNLPGEMQVTVTLKKVSCGTELNIVQEGVPDVIPAEACYLGWQESLTLLTKLVEAEIPDQP